mgnify:CR=1 FL=1
MLNTRDIDLLADRIARKLHTLNDELLSVSEVARMLDKSEGAIKKMCYRGLLPHRKQQKSYYFSKNEITEYLLTKQ